MPEHDIIVIGASAGGVEALSKLVQRFPPHFPASIFIVLHVPPEGRSMLPAIFTRMGPLPATHPEDGTRIERGQIYVAPPDHHLILEPGCMRVVRGPRENRHRPAVDPLFRSAAQYYGPRVIGVILSGALDDGTAGLLAVKRQGGIAIVQDPEEALYSSMPRSALEHVRVDFCCPLAKITELLPRLVHKPAKAEKNQSVPEDMEEEVKIAAMKTNPTNDHEQVGQPSAFSCPECGGVLWEIQDGTLTRFRCRTGHAFAPESMLAEQTESLERTLWFALKTLEERASLARGMAQQAEKNGHKQIARNFEQRMHESEQHAANLRNILEHTSRQVENDGVATFLPELQHKTS